MQVNIGYKIKELRKRDKRTQETMADAIGVTAQAISRWENGGAYPDMELIPSIANYFGVSIDELFGYEDKRQSKIDALVKSIEEKNKLNNGEDVCIEECIVAAREGLIEFPENERLMLCLAHLLYNAGYARYGEHHLTNSDGYDIFDTERHKKYAEWQEAIKLYEKLLSILGEGEMRHKAMLRLIQLYNVTGENEKARLLAISSPDISICRELLMPCCYDGKERANEYERALGKVLSVAAELLVSTVMINREHYAPEKSAKKVWDAISLFEATEDKDTYLAQISHMYLYLSTHQWKSGERDKAFESLERARSCAAQFDAIYNSSSGAGAAFELPEVWPWWCVPDFTEVEAEIKNDPRFDAWAKKCKGEII